MERYSSYKDSGVPWVGEIPVEWGIRQLGRDYEVISGATPSTGDTENWDGDIPWITPADMGSEKYITGGRRNITIKGMDSCGTRMLPINSVIVSNRAPIGLVVITASELCTNQGCKGLVLGSAGNSEFLYYYLSSVKDALDSYGQGTTFKELSRTSLMTFPYPVPSVKEQNAIVDYLDSKTASIDNIIQRSRKSIKRLCEYRQSLINEAVTKGLNPNVPMKDSGVPWIGEIPAAWRVERLRFLGTLSGGGADKKVREGEALFHAAHYMNVYSAASKTLNPATFLKVSLPQEKAKALKLDVGDVLFTSSSETPEDIGHAAVVTEPLPEDSVYGYHLVRFRPASGVYDPSFERYFFESEAARTWLQYRANGITRYGVIGIDYSDYPALVPPIDEQRLIANYLDEKASAIDAAIQGAEESIVRLREYRQSLINEAVTGKIKVPGVEE